MASAMSATPPSDRPRSTSSQPSQASSATANSAYSSTLHGTGDNSSVERRKPSGRDHVDREGERTEHGDGRPRRTAFLGDDLVSGKESRMRRQPHRRSGGFLLESAFPAEEPAQRPQRHSLLDGLVDKSKLTISKRRKSKSPASNSSSHGGYGAGSSAAGSLGEPDREARHDGRSSIETRSSQSGSANAQGLAIDVGEQDQSAQSDGGSSAAGIDPAQIVHMALNLSESRRRHLGAGQLVAPPLTNNRRIASGGLSPSGSPMSQSYHAYGTGGSLREHLQQQRRISRNISPSNRPHGSNSRHVSLANSGTLDPTSIATQPGQAFGYNFSAATIARAEKARIFIELSHEYRRLIRHLPPLRPNSEAPGNFNYVASSIPHTSNFELKRTPSGRGQEYNLGRMYNPLQFIRNRKLRARERRKLDPDVHEFEDVERVKAWVDSVEAATERKQYRHDDTVSLPPFKNGQSVLEEGQEVLSSNKDQHSLFTGKSKRPRMDWALFPSELLADAVWLEQNSHKELIEDRNGNKLFPNRRSMSSIRPRMSKESHRHPENRRLSTVESIPGGHSSESRTLDTSEDGSHRGRKKRHFLSGLRDSSSERVKRHGWRSRGRSSSSSGLSSSSDDTSTRRKRLDRRLTDHEENTGPLERHMKAMAEQEAKKANSTTSASVGSPDKWGASQPARGRPTSSTADEEELMGRNGSISKPLSKKPRRNLSKLLDTDVTQKRFSFEDSSVPTTPFQSNFGGEPSSPLSRVGSPERKSKLSKIPFFRSDGNAKHHKIEATEPSVEATANLKQGTGEPAEPGRLSIDQPARPNINKFPLRTHKTTESLNSLAEEPERKYSKEKKDIKEPSSAVTRFFKGVRNEGTKVGDFIFKKDRPREDSESFVSSDIQDSDDADTDTETANDSSTNRQLKANNHSDGIEELGNVTETEPTYHMDNLPAFKPTNTQEQATTSPGTGPKIEDPVQAQQIANKERGRSSRFNRLAPPQIDMTNVSRSSSPALSHIYEQEPSEDVYLKPVETSRSRSRSPSQVRNCLNKALEVPGGVGRGGIPNISTLSRFDASRGRSSSRPSLPGHRHWSISDQGRRPSAFDADAVVTKADVARVRALLICSGIKAKEITRRAESIRSDPPPFLSRVAETSHTHLMGVPRKEEHVLAAKILSTELLNTSNDVAEAVERFQLGIVQELHQALAELKGQVADDLTPRVHNCADEAEGFIREMTSGYTLAAKAVCDRVDMMGRARRRHMRWVRRLGWVLLEWTVLGLMWWVWLVVVVIRAGLTAVGGLWKGVKWFLWIE
ncbi:hypothetical protein K490DRAFT_68776 [Saccharata proteae CBS 121410]|uniref:Uncharacterized protein n=1 Tax=Saccharata proteae CBS 121410 TaxID=1314787 RepID=A0A9P4LU46_9PEZI|nr:hypothetical protein K490DRAFT_68776 [Saccharata proteae CBS 121410]